MIWHPELILAGIFCVSRLKKKEAAPLARYVGMCLFLTFRPIWVISCIVFTIQLHADYARFLIHKVKLGCSETSTCSPSEGVSIRSGSPVWCVCSIFFECKNMMAIYFSRLENTFCLFFLRNGRTLCRSPRFFTLAASPELLEKAGPSHGTPMGFQTNLLPTSEGKVCWA